MAVSLLLWGQVVFILLCGLMLDVIIGDPQFRLHPVRLIGAAITASERVLRRPAASSAAQRLAGMLAVLLVVGGTLAVAGCLLWLLIDHSGIMLPALLIWVAVAVRDLLHESGAVLTHLRRADLPAARTQVARIVGRDTADLDEPEVVRAAVETVAESACDGIIAPLCWTAVCALPLAAWAALHPDGATWHIAVYAPLGALFCRAVNTLDSMLGHKDDRYRHFGWAAARLDDLVMFVPARLTALLMLLAAPRPRPPLAAMLALVRRDAPRHPSPNAGWPETAAAAALGVQLGGTSFYDGIEVDYPRFGDATRTLQADDILLVNRLVIHALALLLIALCLPLMLLLFS